MAKRSFFQKIADSNWFKKLEKWARVVVLPGFERVPLYDVFIFFGKGLQNGDITNRAAALSFNFFLALFPSVLFLFTLIPYIPIDNFQNQLMEVLQQIMPHSAFEATEETLNDIVRKPHGGILSFGFISALFFSTNGFNSMISGFSASYHEMESRSILMQRVIAFILVVVQTLVIAVAIGLLIFSEVLIHKMHFFGRFEADLIVLGRWLTIFLLFFIFISFTYYLAPASKHGWPFISAGSTFATLLSLLTSLGFSFYVNNFGQYNKLYGSIGTLIVIMMWIYLNSLILLLGFELNASIHTAKKGRIKTTPLA